MLIDVFFCEMECLNAVGWGRGERGGGGGDLTDAYTRRIRSVVRRLVG